MKLGRNETCPCGSGKKYKKCCLDKDQAAERAGLKLNTFQQSLDDNIEVDEFDEIDELSPRFGPLTTQQQQLEQKNLNAVRDQLLIEFEAQDYESQIAFFVKNLDKKELMDDELVFEMLDTIYTQSTKRHEYMRIAPLINMLREQLPEVYQRDRHFYLLWQITNALVMGQFDNISPMANEMAETADNDIDQFFKLIDMLAYHNQLSPLVKAMRITWPLIKGSNNIMDYGLNEFVGKACDYEVLDYLAHHSAPDANDPALTKKFELYIQDQSLNKDRLAHYIGYITGQISRQWQMADFDLARPGSKSHRNADKNDTEPSETGDQRLYFLTLEFLHYLHKEEQVSLIKGSLAREQVQDYLLMRYAGELSPTGNRSNNKVRNKKDKSKSTAKPDPKPAHLLCPDRDSLDGYLVQLLDFINPQFYKMAAVMEVMPAWIRFLELRQLIDTEQGEKALREVRSLKTDLLQIFENNPSDPTIQNQIKSWPEI